MFMKHDLGSRSSEPAVMADGTSVRYAIDTQDGITCVDEAWSHVAMTTISKMDQRKSRV